MRYLHATASLAAISLSIAAHAETTVTDKRTATIRTSTIGAGAADDIRITTTGSVEPTIAGPAVIVDSDHAVVNEGAILISNQSVSAGIHAEAGRAGKITNAANARITIDETYAPADADNDGDLDGPLASGTGRFGIRTAGAFAGDIANSGAITIEGNDSAGIALGGTLDGKLIHDGAITVTGDRSVGIRTGSVTGGVQGAQVGVYSTAVRVAGSVTATGSDAVALLVDGDVGGALVLQGTIAATGYRSASPPADTSKLDADDLLQGGPAVRIAGDVAGGVIVAVPPKDNSSTDNDEDKDGIEDAKEGSGAITSFGSAAAIEIGAATRAVRLGPVPGNGDGHGFVNEGGITGAGSYAGVDGNALVIGGLGQAVIVEGGLTNKGTIGATSSGGNATSLRIGGGAQVPRLLNSGTIQAGATNTANAVAAALLIDQGGALFEISNSGTILAAHSGTASANGASATAILDRSGEVNLVSNSGTIAATGAAAGRNVAIDLSANAAGARISQTVVASGIAAPAITGDIRLGAGNDRFDIADGSVAGDSSFGGGNNRLSLSGDASYAGKTLFGAGNDTVTLAGSSAYAGDVDFGGGTDTLTLGGTSKFAGRLLGAQGLAVAVDGGTLDIGGSSAAIGSLAVGGGGTIVVSVDTANRTNTLYQVAGQASIDGGAKVVVRFDGVAGAEGTYTFVRAGSVSLPRTFAPNSAVLPFMFKGTISSAAPTEIAVTVARKTTTELGLNRSQASAWDAIYTALGKDATLAGVYLAQTDGDGLRRQVRQMLPDHAGGAFESVTMGSRATARFLADPNAPFADMGGWGYWIQQVGWGTSKSIGDTASYDVSGWGVATGGEIRTGLGNFGLSLAYLYGTDADGGTDNRVDAGQYEVGAYWRGDWGALQGWTRASWAHVAFRGKRRFAGVFDGDNVDRRSRGNWSGRLVSAAAGASYRWQSGAFSLRPALSADYYRLSEKGYAETGGGEAFNLIVDGRTSDELAVSGTVAAGLLFGGKDQDSGWFRLEAEAGRRELVGGALGATTARFGGGTAFTLDPEQRTSGWLGRLRAVGGGNGFRIGGEAGAEEQQGRAALSLRASLVVGL